MADKMGILAGTLFLARDLAHKEHLRTRSYAAHMALGSFYEDLIPLVDSLVEAYQGKTGKLVDIPVVTDNSGADILESMRGQLEWIGQTRYEAVAREESALQNIIDEIEALYMATIYKLKFLS